MIVMKYLIRQVMSTLWYVKNVIIRLWVYLQHKCGCVKSRFTLKMRNFQLCRVWERGGGESDDVFNFVHRTKIFDLIDHASNPWLSDKNFFFQAFDTCLESPNSHRIVWDSRSEIMRIFSRNTVKILFQIDQFVSTLAVTAFQIDIMIELEIYPLKIEIGGDVFDFPCDQNPYV